MTTSLVHDQNLTRTSVYFSQKDAGHTRESERECDTINSSYHLLPMVTVHANAVPSPPIYSSGRPHTSDVLRMQEMVKHL